jgi:N6-adenosine-specific RNA methylase IME4
MMDKAEHRAQLERELGARILAMPTKRYGVLYADPPWRFTAYSRVTGMDRAADNHYPTLNLEEISTLQVPAAPDCALFLWATVPMLPHALHVMDAWDFAYKSSLVWVKDHIGTGYWLRNRHEYLLIGTRGSVPAPAMGTQPTSVIEAPRGRHSAKPDAAAEMIERLYPTVPKLELFARKRREGWDSWGNELA